MRKMYKALLFFVIIVSIFGFFHVYAQTSPAPPLETFTGDVEFIDIAGGSAPVTPTPVPTTGCKTIRECLAGVGKKFSEKLFE